MAERKSLETHGEDMDLFLSYLDGYRSMLILSAACQLELFDQVGQLPGGATAAKLAQDNCWDEDAFRRLLDACVAIKTLKKSADPDGKDIYQLVGPGWYLQKSSEISVWETSIAIARRMYESSSKIPEVVRTGVTPKKQESNGHVQEKLDPLRVIQREGFMRPYLKDFLKAFDLSKFKTAVDLGAGSGALTFELCRMYPSMSVTFFDQAKFTSIVQEHLVPKEKLNVTFKTGDYFEDDLPVADLYVMPKNLYAWRPDQLPNLVKRVFAATNSGGGIMLVVKAMHNAKDGPIAAHVWDVIIMADSGGLLRSENEFTSMLKSVGYNDVKIAVTSDTCVYDVILGTKP